MRQKNLIIGKQTNLQFNKNQIKILDTNDNIQLMEKAKVSTTNNMFTQQIDYVVKFENGVFDFNQKGWFLSVNGQTPSKQRSSNSCYAYLQRPCYKLLSCCNKWRIIPQDTGQTYKIVVADGVYTGHVLYAFKDIKSDSRDGGPSYYAFVAPEKYNNEYYKWKISKIGDNLFTIQNNSTKHFLSAHRFYPGDHRDGQSTWVMTHAKENQLSCWKIYPY